MRNDSPFHRPNAQSVQTRRDFLWHAGGGLGGVALAAMLSRDALGVFDSSATPPPLAFAPKAKRVIQLFMSGAASHLDLFDFKPDLIKYDGKPSAFGESVETFQGLLRDLANNCASNGFPEWQHFFYILHMLRIHPLRRI